MLRYFFISLLIGFNFYSFSQTDTVTTEDSKEEKDEYVHLFTNVEEPLVDLGKEEEVKEFKKKRKKKRVFYGYKTKKAFVKKGYGVRQKITVFHYLKAWEKPDPYAKYIYWFHYEKWKIVKTSPARVDQEKGMILHGPFKVMAGEQILEQGIYYKGTKHGRWVKYTKPKDVTYKGIDTVTITGQQKLMEKSKWYKGWPKDSEISYYDREKKLMKEVKPMVNGELHGDYFTWYKNGKVKEYGKYKYGIKIGKWVTYFNGKKRHYKQKVISYPRDPFEKEGRDGTLENEWDASGKMIFGVEKNKLRGH